MHRHLPLLMLLLCTVPAQAAGLLVPEEKSVPPLAMLDHRVTVQIEDQVAITKVEQSFRNHTDRPLEATYIFPVPRGASVRGFSMSVNGQQTKGELLEAAQASQIYTDIVRRTRDPGLLEYMGHNLLRMKIFPVPPHGDVKVNLNYSAVASRTGGAVEYIYPLKTDHKATRTLGKFTIRATIKSQHRVQNIYSPSHTVRVSRPNAHEAVVTFEREQALLGRDFQLFYDVGDKDVGLTALTQRPIAGEDGFFMFLVSPRVDLPPEQIIPRDVVLVLDTSGSMRQGGKIDQARRALKYCLDHLGNKDRFALLTFATTVNGYSEHLLPSAKDQVEQAKKWVDQLDANGGTAIDAALQAALALRTSDQGRTFTIVFFTDGCPTIGETDPQKILKHVGEHNSVNTRIFTFGVGDDVNASLLDQLAEQARALSTYVRPSENIETKVSSLYSQISHPVLADLKMTVGGNVRLSEQYPPQLPDLFHGGQLVVLGRYRGHSHAAIRLSGTVGHQRREFVYEINFPDKTKDEHSFVEDLWARRKVGYLLDQIRAHGSTKELTDEVVRLAKRYGIATPYTSYLVAPDLPAPLAKAGRGWPGPTLRPQGGLAAPAQGGFGGRSASGFGGGIGGGAGYGMSAARQPQRPQSAADLARSAPAAGGVPMLRNVYGRSGLATQPGDDKAVQRALTQAREKKHLYDEALQAFNRKDRDRVQTGKLGVDLALQAGALRNQTHLDQTAQRRVAGRNCLEIGGVWIDEGFDAKMPLVTIKAMSDAYFRILTLHPEIKEVYQLGNDLLWVTPSGSALVIDANQGKDKLADADIEKLFTKGKVTHGKG